MVHFPLPATADDVGHRLGAAKDGGGDGGEDGGSGEGGEALRWNDLQLNAADARERLEKIPPVLKKEKENSHERGKGRGKENAQNHDEFRIDF